MHVILFMNNNIHHGNVKSFMKKIERAENMTCIKLAESIGYMKTVSLIETPTVYKQHWPQPAGQCP